MSKISSPYGDTFIDSNVSLPTTESQQLTSGDAGNLSTSVFAQTNNEGDVITLLDLLSLYHGQGLTPAMEDCLLKQLCATKEDVVLLNCQETATEIFLPENLSLALDSRYSIIIRPQFKNCNNSIIIVYYLPTSTVYYYDPSSFTPEVQEKIEFLINQNIPEGWTVVPYFETEVSCNSAMHCMRFAIKFIGIPNQLFSEIQPHKKETHFNSMTIADLRFHFVCFFLERCGNEWLDLLIKKGKCQNPSFIRIMPHLEKIKMCQTIHETAVKLLSLYNEKVSSKSEINLFSYLTLLTPSQPLIGSAIYQTLMLLAQDREDVLVLDTIDLSEIFSISTSSGKLFMAPVKIQHCSKFDAILGVCLVNSSHWVFIYIDIKYSRFYYVDPAGYSAKDSKQALESWKEYARQCGNPDLTAKEWSEGICYTTKQKRDDLANCGIYCLVFAKDFLDYPPSGSGIVRFDTTRSRKIKSVFLRLFKFRQSFSFRKVGRLSLKTKVIKKKFLSQFKRRSFVILRHRHPKLFKRFLMSPRAVCPSLVTLLPCDSSKGLSMRKSLQSNPDIYRYFFAKLF